MTLVYWQPHSTNKEVLLTSINSSKINTALSISSLSFQNKILETKDSIQKYLWERKPHLVSCVISRQKRTVRMQKEIKMDMDKYQLLCTHTSK